MILALDKHAALYIFSSAQDVECYLEAIDVQEDEFEFCDARGQRYSPTYTLPPKRSRLGPIGFVDIGAFKLVTDGGIHSDLPERFIERAATIEYTSLPAITNIEVLRDELHKRA